MIKAPVSRTASLMLFAAALVAAPLAIGGNGSISYDQAFAQKGGNGNGNGNAGGNAASSNAGGNKVASTDDSSSAASSSSNKNVANGKGKIASKLGALNAAHASAQAFAHASPNSRIGRIAAYYHANEAAAEAAAAASEAQANLDLVKAVTAAQAEIDALDPTDPDYDANLAAAQTKLTEAQAAAIAAGLDGVTEADAQAAADAAAAEAAAADAEAQAALDAAANKTPVDAETRAALDALLEGKFPEETAASTP